MDPGLEERLRRRSREMGFDPYLDTPFRDPALHAEDGSSDPPPPDSPDFHDDGNDHGKYRFLAYRFFTRWIWKRLGRHNRVVLPACVVTAIRKQFPSADYVGFRYPPL
ncbi:hypothetical protein MTO96_034491 [Rhipicephalus appendiculatus]